MKQIRNIAIIAHVDHGKTTLVDQLLRQSGTFRANQQVDERVMDSNDLEKERGITILAKNTAIDYEGYHINIVDTPGHADFGGEVERVLGMVDCVVLLVDAQEGPMPQTRFVTKKALALGLKPIVVINKIDKPSARPSWVIDQTFELFDNLGATDEQLDFPIVYASGLSGFAKLEETDESNDMRPLFDTILKHTPAPSGSADETLQLQISQLDYDNYTGRLGIGRILNGRIKPGQVVAVMNHDQQIAQGRINQLLGFKGLERVPLEEAEAGDIVIISGIEDIGIGVTITDKDNPKGLPMLSVDEPTLTMDFMVNTSPLAGTEGKFVTSRQIRDRLQKELLTNVALRVEDTADADVFRVSGRGELHLTILLENMRREGFELAVGKPRVVFREINGQKCEPYESLVVDVPEEYASKVIDLATQRKGDLHIMETKGEMQHLEFDIPSRGLIGLRSQMLTATAGEAIMAHRFSEYKPFKGAIPSRINGVLISKNQGQSTAYSIEKLQDRGRFFVDPGEEVYMGMIVGEQNKPGDLVVNIVEGKQLNNMRAAGKDKDGNIAPKVLMTLEECMEYIQHDECIEVTPNFIRMRKKLLSEEDRKRAERSAKTE